MAYLLHFDGGSRMIGGSSRAGCGFALYSSKGVLLERHWHALPNGSTCNEAEYKGLLLGLNRCKHLGLCDIAVRGDSKLVINQVFGRWKAKAPNLRPYVAQAKRIVASMGNISAKWVPRRENAEADRLANRAMDERCSGADILVRVNGMADDNAKQSSPTAAAKGDTGTPEKHRGQLPSKRAKAEPGHTSSDHSSGSKSQHANGSDAVRPGTAGSAAAIRESPALKRGISGQKMRGLATAAAHAGGEDHTALAPSPLDTPPSSQGHATAGEIQALYDPLIVDAERYLSTLYARRDAAFERLEHSRDSQF